MKFSVIKMKLNDESYFFIEKSIKIENAIMKQKTEGIG